MEILIGLVLVSWAVYCLVSRSTRSTARSDKADALEIRVEVSSRTSPNPISLADAARASNKLWVPRNTACTVAGRLVTDGMLYVGDKLAPISGWGDADPALINPRLSVPKPGKTVRADPMGYWPSYSEVTPANRAVYLDWLANGRCDPDIDLGYVFLFFYGLERRLMVDLPQADIASRADEAQLLVAELERLLSIYGEHRSFRGYGRSLIEAASIIHAPTPAYLLEPPVDASVYEVSSVVRLAIGQLVNEGRPIPSAWAFAWVVQDPETRLRTPSKRCPDEFRSLFLARYEARFGEGMIVKPNKRRLRIEYRGASASLREPIEIPCGDLPDVSSLSRPLKPLRALIDGVEADLSAYSRIVGRSPAASSSPEAIASLPSELAAGRSTPEIEALFAWLTEALGDNEIAVVPARDVLSQWPSEKEDRLSKRELGSLARLLASRGVGIDPDPQFGASSLRASANVAVFKTEEGPVDAPSTAYRSTALLLHLSAIVAAGDGEIAPEERTLLDRHITTSAHLSEAEIRRLRAHVAVLLSQPPSTAGLKKRLEAATQRQKKAIADFAVAVAGADGRIDPGEIKTLQKLYRMLGLDPGLATADIHSMKAASEWCPADQPVTVRPPAPATPFYPIPPDPVVAKADPGDTVGGFFLDMERVERTLAETAVVSSLLSEIFDDEPETTELPVEEAPSDAPRVAGLDVRHSAVLRELAGNSRLSRERFDAVCDGVGLLSDGAIEVLNDAAFEAVDYPLIEGDDPLEIDTDALEAMFG